MTARERRRFANRQVLELERLEALVEDHPIMGPLMAARINQYRSEIEGLGESKPEARTVLFFTGRPVSGSAGIDAQFAADVLRPFIEMVKAQYATEKHGEIGERGRVRDEDEARLVLTGTPRGSFGLELSPPSTDDLFAEERLSAVLVRLSRVIEAAGESDEDFLLNLDDVSQRTYAKLPEFFHVLRDRGADLRMQTGDLEFVLPHKAITEAFERVSSSHTEERVVSFDGSFRGATLDSWRFDFRREDGETISGRISSELTEEAVAEMLGLIKQQVRAELNQITVTTKGGALRRRFVLLGIEETK